MCNGQFMAVKRIRLQLEGSSKTAERELEELQLEISILKGLENPRIVRYYGCLQDEVKQEFLIFLKVAGDLVSSFGREDRKRWIPWRRLSREPGPPSIP